MRILAASSLKGCLPKQPKLIFRLPRRAYGGQFARIVCKRRFFMYAKRKLLLGILSAVIFVCAAVLLILPLRTSVVRAQMTQDPGKYTSLAIKTQDISLEAGMQAEELKEHITVTAYYDGGSDELSPDDYTLSLREGGFLLPVRSNTLVATINKGTATGSVCCPRLAKQTMWSPV